jgi:hypothetical protein
MMLPLALGGSSLKDLVFSVDGEERHRVGGARRDRLRSVAAELLGVGRLVVDEDHIGWYRGLLCPPSAPMRQIGRVEEGRISGSS